MKLLSFKPFLENKKIKKGIAAVLLFLVVLIGASNKNNLITMANNEYHIEYVDINTYEESEEYSNYFIVGFDKDMSASSNLSMEYTDGKKSYKTTKYNIEGNNVVFFTDDKSGSYELTEVNFTKDGKEITVNLKNEAKREENVDTKYNVDLQEEYTSEEEDKALDMADYLTPKVTNNSKVTAIGEATIMESVLKGAASSDKVVIMLDPGHGGTDPGANRTYNGLKYTEANLCLSIANLCKKELDTYSNAEVYLTRSTDTYVALSKRSTLAKDKGAIVLVSMHLNSTGSSTTTATGCEAIYQNSNYKPKVARYSKELAQAMVNGLKATGLKYRSIYSKNSSSTKYADGSKADYFSINRESKKLGIAGIIVEHCFINNTSDFENYLLTIEGLNKLATADAKSIASYLELNESTGTLAKPVVTDAEMSGSNSVRVNFTYSGSLTPTGFYLYRSTTGEDGSFTKVATTTSTNNYIVDTKAESGNTYYYKVKAYSDRITGLKTSGYSDVVKAYVIGAPTITKMSKSSSGTTITFDEVKGAEGYEVYRSNASGGYDKITSTKSTSYTDNTSSLCAYKVRAYLVNNGSTVYSPYGAARIVDTSISYVQGTSSTTNKVVFNSLSGASGYRVYRKLTSESTYVLLKNIEGNSTLSYSDSKAVLGKRYNYKVTAYINVGGTAVESMGVSVKSEVGLAAPTFKGAIADSSGAVTVNWAKVSGAAGYQIFRINKASDEWVKVGIVTGESTLSYTDKSTVKGTTYIYAVNAYKTASGKNHYSSKTGKHLSAPQLKAILQYGADKTVVTWNTQSNVDGYIIKRRVGSSGSYSDYATVSGASTDTYYDAKATKGKTYYYKVVPYRTDDGKKITGTVYSGTKCAVVAAPKISEATIIDGAYVTLKYSSISGASGYEITRSESADGTYSKIATVNDTSYKDKTIVYGKQYYYKVRATFAKNGVTGYTGYSAKVLAEEGIENVVSLDSSSIKITWSKKAAFSSLNIYRKKSSQADKKYVLLGNVATAKGEYTDKGLSEGVKYTYKVELLYKSNGKETVGNTEIIEAQTLVKPSNVKAVWTEDGAITISWDKVSSATGYVVYRSSTNEANSYSKMETVKGASETSIVENLGTSGKMYYYKVKAYATSGEETGYSGYSGVAISGVKPFSVELNGSKVKLTWEKLAGADTYTIYRKESNESSFKKLKSVSGDKSTYTDSSISSSAIYQYKIRAVAGKYTSWYSVAVSTSAVPQVKGVKAAANSNGSHVVLTWNEVSGATKYQIDRKTDSTGTYKNIGTVKSATTFTDSTSYAGYKYYYRVRAVMTIDSKAQYGAYSDEVSKKLTVTKVMGTSEATKAQMAQYFKNSGKKYPSIYAKKEYGAVATIEDFVQIIIEESKAEGVRADVVCAQVYKETGYLQFGGDVKAKQCNFAGLGATGGGAKGASFDTVRLGIRAQVQHLKAYAMENPTYSYEVIDPRYSALKSAAGFGKAAYIEWLGKANNPYGKGWAVPGDGYGFDLISMIKKMKTL